MLEHVRDWRVAVSNIKNACKPNGIMLLTTQSLGSNYHAFPDDFWRYEISDMQNIFQDCKIEKLETDKVLPGVFIKATKPINFIEHDLFGYELYSVITKKKIINLDEKLFIDFKKKYFRRQFVKISVRRAMKIIRLPLPLISKIFRVDF